MSHNHEQEWPQTYRREGLLVAVGVDGGQQVDARLVHQVAYARVSAQILLTHELHEQQKQLAAQHLVTVGTGRVAELGLTCEHTHTHTLIQRHTHLRQRSESSLTELVLAGVVRDLDGVQLLSVVAFADVVDARDVRTHVIHHLHQLNTNTTEDDGECFIK